MKRGLMLVVCVFLVFSMTFVSAGWFSDLIKTIFLGDEPSFSPELGEKEDTTKGIDESISREAKPEEIITQTHHKECIGSQCVYVQGPGEDECNRDSDCMQNGEECVDSDGGINYSEQGTCNDGRIHTDFCLGKHRLREYYCSDRDNCLLVNYYCESRCGNGKCLNYCDEDNACLDLYYEYTLNEGDEILIGEGIFKLDFVSESFIFFSISLDGLAWEEHSAFLYQIVRIYGLNVHIQPVLLEPENNSAVIKTALHLPPYQTSISCINNKIYAGIITYGCFEHQCNFDISSLLVEECSDSEYCLNGYNKCLLDDPSNVEITDDKRFIINYEPVFPLGLWVGGALDEYSFDEFRDAGINLVIVYPGAYNPANVDGYMSRCAFNLELANELGMYAFIGVSSSPELFGNGSEIRDEVIQNMIECSYRAPAFIGRLSDEPAWVNFLEQNFTPDEHNRLFQDFKEKDPYEHILWINHAPTTTGERPLNKTRFIEDINLYNNADVKSIDVYPIENRMPGHCYLPPPNVPEKVSCVGEYVDILREAVNDEMPVGMTLLGRDPDANSVKERRFMAYQAIAHGAKGLTYWGGLSEGAATVVSELSSINSVLASEDVEREVVNRDGIKTLLKECNGKVYLISVNELNESVENVEFYNLSSYNSARVLFEDRSIFINNGQFVDGFEDYGVHVYYLREEDLDFITKLTAMIKKLFFDDMLTIYNPDFLEIYFNTL